MLHNLLPVTCGPEAPPSDKYDDQDDVEKAAQEECGADDDLKDEEDDGCAGINLHHITVLVNPISPQPISSIIFCIEFLCSEAKNDVLSKQVIICSCKELLYKTVGNNNAVRAELANTACCTK